MISDKDKLKTIFRNSSGLVGETSRVLTEFYFNPKNYLFSEFDNPLENLINHRNSLYHDIDLVQELNELEVEHLIEFSKNDLPFLFSMFHCLENFDDFLMRKTSWQNINLVYSIAKEEHIKKSKVINEKPIIRLLGISYEQRNFLNKTLKTRYDLEFFSL